MTMSKTSWASTLLSLVLALPIVSAWNAYQANSFQSPGQQFFNSNSPSSSPSLASVGALSQSQKYNQTGMKEAFVPLDDFSALSEEHFTTMGHPLFPSYNVRIKKSTFCDGTVRSYTGYIDIEARHLFFYFFESRNDPDTDDVIFWTNGGPGCSSSIGLFMELGPCRVLDEDGPKFHPESWNNNANIFFIDQPVGVGFSYAEHGEYVGTTEEAAKDIAAFVAIFFENFQTFKGRAFHMAGESYGGRYLPLFASAVYDQNTQLVDAGLTPVNLQSVMIGNGLTDVRETFLSYYDMTCTSASVDPILSIGQCVYMKSTLSRCDAWVREGCQDQYDTINCRAASNFCQYAVEQPFFASGMNPYDISKKCEGVISETLCYPITKHITNYLSRPPVWSRLGVDRPAQRNFTSCARDVGSAFAATQDRLHPTSDYVASLLERGIRVLIYVGTYDWICNHVGNERWTRKLEWSGKADFSSLPLREWVVDGKRAGLTRSAKGFTFATIEGAGHMAPYDKPVESLRLVQRWLANEGL